VEIAVRIVFPPFVVITVCDLVADDDTDGAVVYRVVHLRVEKWRLQDSGREHDFILRRVEIGIDRLRGHLPLAPVNGFANARELPPRLKLAGALDIAPIIIPHNFYGRIIAELVRITDLLGEAVEFRE